MLFDTDVLVWVFRGNADAARLVEADAERWLTMCTGNLKHYRQIKELETRAFKP